MKKRVLSTIKIMNFGLLIALIFFWNCSGKLEKQYCTELNNLHSKYDFTCDGSLYLKVRLKNNNYIDTLELKNLYDSIFSEINSTSKKLNEIPWVYMNIYNSKKEYLFGIVKTSSDNKFYINNIEFDM